MSTASKLVGREKMKLKKQGLDESEQLELERLEDFLLGKGKSVLKNADITLAKSASEEKKPAEKIRKPAWEDADDSSLSVSEALSAQGRPKMGVPGKPTEDYQTVLKRRFETRVGNPKWAKLDQGVEDDHLLKRCGNMIDSGPGGLVRGVLDIKKLRHLNKSQTGVREGPYINSVRFHPSSTVALVAGSAAVASIYQVDGSSNPHLKSVKFEKFPIRCARFTADGQQVIVGSQHQGHYFIYDMMADRSIRIPTHHATEQTNMKKFEVSPDGKMIAVCGRFGQIHLLHTHTREWLSCLQMNGEVTALCFSPDSAQLWTHGDAGEVYVWDVAARRCLHRWVDEGCLMGRSIAISPSSQLVACGSSSGVVNVYEMQQALQSPSPQPAKALQHLVTAASSLQFNPSSEILGMASDDKDGAFKLVHFPSMTVFSNFPARDSLVGRAVSLHFSPASGYLAIGNNQNTAQLFRLNHFGNY